MDNSTQTQDTYTDLASATNLFGYVGADYAARIILFLNEPTARHWDDVHGILIDGGSWTTVWQAVIALDPSYSHIGRVTDLGGKIVKDWTKVPTADLVRRAIHYATA